MAQHDARPERDPGGFAYLSSLGLDDDDGLDAAMHDASGDFASPWLQPVEDTGPTPHSAVPPSHGSRPAATPFATPGHLAHAGEPPVGGPDGVPPHPDPTAGWSLPDQEDLVGHEPPQDWQLPDRDEPAAHEPPQNWQLPDRDDLVAHEPQPDWHLPDRDDLAVHEPPSGGQPTVAEGPVHTAPAPTDAYAYPPAHDMGPGHPGPTPPSDEGAHDETGPGFSPEAHVFGDVPGPVTSRLDMHRPSGHPPEHSAAEPAAPLPDDVAEPVDTWQDEWQPEALGSRHPTLHRPTPTHGGRSSRRNVPSLTAETVLRTREPRPGRGWRRAIYTVSGGRVNLGMSGAELREQDMIRRARAPLSGCHRLAVISLKGGVGKTTTTAALGSVLATLRGDRVIAVDANPDRGTLAERIHAEPTSTVRALLDVGERVTRYAEVRQFTSQAPTRLEVLASDSDPGVSQAFSERDYHETIAILERFYNLILTDCGTGLLHSAMRGILGVADSLVIVSSASLDGARSASATLDWLEAHGLADVVSQAVTVISTVRPGGGSVDVDRLEDHFAHRCRSVVTIPYDPHLEAGGVLELDELGSETRDAYYELAAEVGEGFPLARSERH